MAAKVDVYSLAGPAVTEDILARYRRPLSGPLVESYVAACTRPGDLVLDPFCQGTSVLRASALAGRRAVAVTGNPLLALLARVEAAPPSAPALEAALERLRQAPKGDVALAEHLDGLYATVCSRCGARVPAISFAWERGGGPVQREYACPHCGHAAREPAAPDERAERAVDPPGFHRRLVAERLRTGEDHHRLQERLLDLYTPRNTYALVSLLLKIELLFAGSPLLDALRAAFLHTLDVSSRLNLVTEAGWQPVHSLEPPRRTREANVWRAFVEAVRLVAARAGAQPLPLAATLDQVMAGPGGAYLGLEGLAKATAHLRGQVALAVGALPRFDPAFAALSYLWSGWVLGKEGARAAERLLRQRAPEEGRYLQALQSALGAVGVSLAPHGALALVFQAPGTRYLETALLAAGAAGLPLHEGWHGMLDDRPASRFGVRRVEHHLLFDAPASQGEPDDASARARSLAARTAVEVLRRRAEPAPFTALHGPIWDALAREGLLGGARGAAQVEERRRRIEEAVRQGLEAALGDELALGGVAEDVAWWLVAPPEGEPLADRVEMVVRELLARGDVVSEGEMAHEVASRFPGALAPSYPFIQTCLTAYGARQERDLWLLAPEAVGWRDDALHALREIAPRLGYEAAASSAGTELPGMAEGPDLEWREAGVVSWAFFLRDTASSSGVWGGPPPAYGRRVLVIPQRRLLIWRHKLARAPQWGEALERNHWSFLRAEALAALLQPGTGREHFQAALGLGPAGGPGEQLPLFTSGP